MGQKFRKVVDDIPDLEPQDEEEKHQKSKKIFTECRVVLLGTESSGKSTTFYQISEKNKEGDISYTLLKENTIKVWFNILETAYILITTSNLINMEKEGKDITHFFKNVLYESRFGFQNYEDEYGQLLKNAYKSILPIFNKIIKLYTKYNTFNLVDQLRKRHYILYFDGMEQ